MTAAARAWGAVATLVLIVAITASWWALALWPLSDAAPDWLLRTRAVCFGATATRLPDAGGWILLIGQPFGMAVLLAAIWGAELKRGMTLVMANVAGQLAAGAVAAALLAGVATVGVRVRTASLDTFDPGPGAGAQALNRLNDVAPALALIDQSGREVTLASFRGRPVLVAFAYAHCATVCPLIVSDVIGAQRQLGDKSAAVLLVTLDPWRDTPSRLPAIASHWGVAGDAHVLSGPPDAVERTLNAWRIPRTRNQKTGEISHPSMVYVVSAEGRIAYAVTGGADAISAAVRALP